VALARSILSRLASATSARIDLDRAIRPSNTTHSASAIDEIASITSADGSSRSRLLSWERASILPIRPSAHAADIATPPLRSSRRSSEARSGRATDGRSDKHRLEHLALGAATTAARQLTTSASRDARLRLGRSAIPALALLLARSSPRRHLPRHGHQSGQEPRSQRPVRESGGECRIQRSGGIARQAPERPRRVACAPLPRRARSYQQDPIPQWQRSTPHPRCPPTPWRDTGLAIDPVPPRRPGPRKDRAVVRASDHDAPSRRSVKSARNDTNRKIFFDWEQYGLLRISSAYAAGTSRESRNDGCRSEQRS
jgi:hypothetical protein